MLLSPARRKTEMEQSEVEVEVEVEEMREETMSEAVKMIVSFMADRRKSREKQE